MSRPAGEVLRLLSMCPDMPAEVLSVLRGGRNSVSTEQLLRRLESANFVHKRLVALPPLLGSRRLALWSATAEGTGTAVEAGLLSTEEASLVSRSRRSQNPGTVVPHYWLLAAVLVDSQRYGVAPRVIAWTHPWMHARGTGMLMNYRTQLLTGVHVVAPRSGAKPTDQCLVLLPDLGTSPVRSYTIAVRRLFALCAESSVEHVLVIGTPESPESTTRKNAWSELVRRAEVHVGHRVPVRVLTWPQAADMAPSISGLAAYARPTPDRDRWSLVDLGFGLISRHPFLTRGHLASLLGIDRSRAGRLLQELCDRGWVRRVPDSELERTDMPRTLRSRLELVELTTNGRRVAARRLLLPSSSAARHHGLLSVRHHQLWLVHLAHEIGVNSVFVALAEAARARRQSGGDDALEEWRSAPVCARGGFRPDGYGCYRHRGVRYGFFLEYDRGTERAREYAAKLRAYYRYRAGRAQRDYAGFPILLVVTTSKRAEATIAEQTRIAGELRGGCPLEVLIATTDRIGARGILGPVWRSPLSDGHPDDPTYRSWLPEDRLPGAGRRGRERVVEAPSGSVTDRTPLASRVR
jgi:DNA-binding MarR family transcriptional regulator